MRWWWWWCPSCAGLSDWASRAFQDPRLVVAVNTGWLFLVVLVFRLMGGFDDNQFIRFGFGPSANLEFVGAHIDTWWRWLLMVAFVIVNAMLEMWGNNVNPWLINSVYVPSERLLKYSRPTTLAIADMTTGNDQLFRLINLLVSLTQVDIWCFRVLTMIAMTHVYTWHATRAKITPAEQEAAADGGDGSSYSLTQLDAADQEE